MLSGGETIAFRKPYDTDPPQRPSPETLPDPPCEGGGLKENENENENEDDNENENENENDNEDK